MADISKWSATADNNSEAAPNGWPEGMLRSDVNNAAREMMAAIRTFYAAAEFVNVHDTTGDSWSPVKNADTVVQLEPDNAQTTDISGRFPAGTRFRLLSSSTYYYGFVVTSGFSTPNTTVTVAFDVATDVVPATIDNFEICPLRDALGKTAYYPTGATTGQEPPQVPTIDDLGDGATLDQGSGNGFDADTVDGQHASDLIAAVSGNARNQVYNGEFMIWQRGTSITADTTSGRIYTNDNDNYCADRWKILSGVSTTPTNDIADYSRDTASPPTGYWSYLTMTGATVPANARAGIFQILEARDSASLIGSTAVSMGMEFKRTGSIGFARFMLLGWTGTADSITYPDPISNWEAAGDATGPTFQSGWTKLMDSGQTAVDVTWARETLENIDISGTGGVTNLAILIYIDDGAWNTLDTLSVTGIKIEAGTVAGSYQRISAAEELSRCQRYFLSSFSDGSAPRRAAGIAEAITGRSGFSGSTSPYYHVLDIPWKYPTEMYQIPTVTGFNAVADNANEVVLKPVAGTTSDYASLSSWTQTLSTRQMSLWYAINGGYPPPIPQATIYLGVTLDAEF